jgi:hypothetical protein
MSTMATVAKPTTSPASAQKSARRCHVVGGGTLGQEHSREAQRWAAVILEVLAGSRTPAQAALALGVSLPRYYQLETRALRGLVASCETRPKGPRRSSERELAALRRQHEGLQRELQRQQTLLRLAQRSLGLPPPAPPVKPAAGKKRRRRPVVRALSAAAHLQQQSQATSAEAALGEEKTT